MKRTRKLIPAVAMLLISAIMLSTASYAWFSMNTQVTATGMQVKAEAEGGIVISNESKTDWKASSTASHNTSVGLVPTSTANVADWYHATSTDANDAADGQGAGNYTKLTVAEADGVGSATIGTETKNVYLLNKFYIKSSAEAMTSIKLYINRVTVTGASTSAELDKSLRVAISVGGQVYIFAPITGGDTSYEVAGSGTATTAIAAGTLNTETTVTSIPANTSASPVEASVYIYFEGEDPACKSNNITSSLDTLTVEVTFGTTQIS